MSRHTLIPNNPNHEVVVGWDRGLNDFYIQVFDLAESARIGEEVLVDDHGCNPLKGELSYVDFVKIARQYGHLSDKLAREILEEMQGKRETNISKDYRI